MGLQALPVTVPHYSPHHTRLPYIHSDYCCYCRTLCSYRRRTTTICKKQVAIIIIQAFARCICARYRILRQADAIYRRVWDTESNNYYYAQVITGTTSWVKSSVYLHANSEPPILNKKEIQQQKSKGSSKKVSVQDNKRSPRRNRLP